MLLVGHYPRSFLTVFSVPPRGCCALPLGNYFPVFPIVLSTYSTGFFLCSRSADASDHFPPCTSLATFASRPLLRKFTHSFLTRILWIVPFFVASLFFLFPFSSVQIKTPPWPLSPPPLPVGCIRFTRSFLDPFFHALFIRIFMHVSDPRPFFLFYLIIPIISIPLSSLFSPPFPKQSSRAFI